MSDHVDIRITAIMGHIEIISYILRGTAAGGVGPEPTKKDGKVGYGV